MLILLDKKTIKVENYFIAWVMIKAYLSTTGYIVEPGRF